MEIRQLSQMGFLFCGAILQASFSHASAPTADMLRPEAQPEAVKASPQLPANTPVEAEGLDSGGGVDAKMFVKLAKRLMPSVVNISTITMVKGGLTQGGPDELLRRFFGDVFPQYPRSGRGADEEDDGLQAFSPNANSKASRAMSLGAGFIIDSSGLILTNHHVVQDADEIKIFFTEAKDEKPTDAEVLGRDAELDVALIRVKKKKDLVPVIFGDSDSLEVGEYVAAIGNPIGQGHSITHGIISAKGRIAPELALANYLQTDTPINPGNSGGPLINLRGEVIGINNAIIPQAQGIGFAIPINLVKKILPQLRTKGSVERGYIGVIPDNLTPEIAAKMGVSKDVRGSMVSHVYPNDPAEQAGVKPYDIILEFNGKNIQGAEDLLAAVIASTVGETVPMKVLRNKENLTLNIKIGKRPAQSMTKKERLKRNEKKKKRPDIGMSVEDITPNLARDLGLSEKTAGVVVSNVAYDGPADKSGINRGDVITEIDRKPVQDSEEFYSIVKEKGSYLLKLRRGDSQGNEGFTVVVLNVKR